MQAAILSRLYKPVAQPLLNFVVQSFNMKTTPEFSTTTKELYDVIISGAGPVGLFLACELALAGCSVLILEKSVTPHSPLKQMPFGIRGLSSTSIEALDRRGLFGELEVHKRVKEPHSHQAKLQGPGRQSGHFAGIPFHEADIDVARWKYRLPGATPPVLLSEMQEIETILTRRAEALGVSIKRGFAVTGFHQTDDSVTVNAEDQVFRALWLVGCDGSRSIVRKAGGFEFAGTEPEFTGYSAQVEIADPQKLHPGRNLTAKGMYLQSQPGYIIIQDFDGGEFHNSGKPVTATHIQEVLRRISDTDVTITALRAGTTWTDRSRQATAYRNGRVLLAGDAAHIHSPLGGQGLNLGLGDAMNLGWKLAATIQNQAPEGLLNSYETERYPIGAQVLNWSRAQVAIMKPDPASRALNAIVRDLMNTRDGATYFAGKIWGIYTHYPLNEHHPLAGYSVPAFELENDTGINSLMRDGQGILLDFSNNTLLKSLADEYAPLLKYVSGSAKEQLGLSAVLIRPDGIVAWACDGEPDYRQLRKVAGSWF